jgi:hypothetical protein
VPAPGEADIMGAWTTLRAAKRMTQETPWPA